MILLAIDPGAKGGMAAWDGDKIWTIKNPESEGDWISIIQDLGKGVADKIAVVERQAGFLGKRAKNKEGQNTGDGDNDGQVGAALRLFSLGESYGFLRGVIQCSGWRTIRVTPQQWQKGLSLGNSKSHATRTLWKNHCKAEAQRLYPDLKITLQTADALLLLEYARRQRFNAPTGNQMRQGELV